MEHIKMLEDGLSKMQIPFDKKTIDKFLFYMDFLLDWNEKVNLTAIKDKKDVVTKHFLDSLTVYDEIKEVKNAKIIDIGTGAGFPGVPLKLIDNDIYMTLCDSVNKKITFLKSLCENLELENITSIHARAEDINYSKEFNCKYDFCVSRAVANLSVLSLYALPFVKANGKFIALKGNNVSSEIEEFKKYEKSFNCEILEVKQVEIPFSNLDHSLIIIRKLREIPQGNYKKILKQIKTLSK